MPILSQSITTIVTPEGNTQVALIATTDTVLDCTAPDFDQQERDAVEADFRTLFDTNKNLIDTAILQKV